MSDLIFTPTSIKNFQGLFFCMEGIDGTGKSTQIGFLKEKLIAQGYSVEIVREPGGCSISEQIREILISNQNKEMSSLTELLLFMASREQLIREVLLPKLKSEKVIILADRFVWSTIAYQYYGRKIYSALDICKTLCNKIYPHYTFVLDFSLKDMKNRLKQKKIDRMEFQDDAFFKKVRQGYQDLNCENSFTSTLISANQTKENIADLIWNKVDSIIQKWVNN